MSYWINLRNENGALADVESHKEGGTYMLGGTSSATLNVTYNYGSHFRDHLDKEEGLCWLDGKRARDCLSRLEEAVSKLGTERADDYWAATPGNAGHTLSILLGWAKQHPQATFHVS